MTNVAQLLKQEIEDTCNKRVKEAVKPLVTLLAGQQKEIDTMRNFINKMSGIFQSVPGLPGVEAPRATTRTRRSKVIKGCTKVGAWVTSIRRAYGATQVEFAKELKVKNQSIISTWERGVVQVPDNSLAMLIQLSKDIDSIDDCPDPRAKKPSTSQQMGGKPIPAAPEKGKEESNLTKVVNAIYKKWGIGVTELAFLAKSSPAEIRRFQKGITKTSAKQKRLENILTWDKKTMVDKLKKRITKSGKKRTQLNLNLS